MGAGVIYKICTAAEWREAEANGAFSGSAADHADGYIHFSTAAQLPGTLRRHFAGQRALVLVAVDVAGLAAGLRWEPARDGQMFPHLYGVLPLASVRSVEPLEMDGTGKHRLPPLAS